MLSLWHSFLSNLWLWIFLSISLFYPQNWVSCRHAKTIFGWCLTNSNRKRERIAAFRFIYFSMTFFLLLYENMLLSMEKYVARLCTRSTMRSLCNAFACLMNIFVILYFFSEQDWIWVEPKLSFFLFCFLFRDTRTIKRHDNQNTIARWNEMLKSPRTKKQQF